MTDFHTQTWLIAWETLRSLSRHYSPEMARMAAQEGVEESHGGLLITAISFHPDPISEEVLQRRIPYQRYVSRLESMHHAGWLSRSGDTYELTAAGESIARKIVQAAYDAMDRLRPLKPPEMNCLNQLLRKVVLACVDAPEPPGKWSIRHARRLDPGESAGVTIKLDQYLSDLAAYRDDSHLAAWQPHGISGPVWETFDCFCQEKADTVDGLLDYLNPRGFPAETYREAIDGLVDKGWIRVKKGKVHVTEQGMALRQKTEETTDQYFFAPWSVLSVSELEMMQNLLQMVTIGLD